MPLDRRTLAKLNRKAHHEKLDRLCKSNENTNRAWSACIRGKWFSGGYHRLTRHPERLPHFNLTQLTFTL